MDHPLSYNEVRKHIAGALPEPAAFNDDQNLIELGLDSLTMMRLVSRWRRAGAAITFAEAISSPRLRDWWSLLQRPKEEASGNAQAKERAENEDGAVPQRGPFPLTDVQYAYWIGRRDDQPLGGVGCHAYLELDGKDVEPARLEAAWGQLLARHAMLRARFLASGEQEVMEAPPAASLAVHDLRHCPEKELAGELERIRNRLSHRRLNVEQGEVAGIELSLLPGARTRLHLDIDLLVADVQSLHILLRDLASAYARGIPPAAPAEWSFADYIRRETMRRTAEREAAARYWKERLPTLPGAPDLPLKERPEAVRAPVFKRRQHDVAPADWERLQRKAAACGLTPAMVLLAAYAEVLERWSANSRFLINVPLFDRQTDEAGMEDVIADFTNLLLLEVDCSAPQPFAERVRSVQAQFHRDVAHAAYSGVQLQRDLTRAPHGDRQIAPVVFACNLGTPLINDECREALGKLAYMISQTPQVWLDFQAYEMDGGLLLAWDAVDRLFPDGLVDRMFAAFTEWIDWLAEESNDWQASPDRLWEAERASKDKALQLPPAPAECLHTAFFEQASAQPGLTAVIDGRSETSYSYGELSAYALKVAALLRDRGVAEGDPVAVTLERGIDQLAAVLGVLAAGACYVPLGIGQPTDRRIRMCRKAGIRFALTDRGHVQAGDWPEDAVVLHVGDAAGAAPLAEPVRPSPDRPAYIIFTSGSTGEPKGVENPHAGAWNTVADINRRYGVGRADRILAVSALDFDLSVYDMFGLLSAGGSLVLISEVTRRDAASWLGLLDRHRVTIWNSVPILLDMLLVAAESVRRSLPSLRLALLSGDWIGLDLPERLKRTAEGCRLVALGGATEASIWSNCYEVSLPLPKDWKSIPYGRPLTNQAYRIVDSKGRDCPDWVAGELWIGGAGVASGYRGDAALSAERFVEGNGSRWYRTGDLGRYWPDGTIEFLGRKDFQVKIRGHRIELGEIEAALKQHPGVRDAVVMAAGDPRGTRQLVGYIVPDRDHESWLAGRAGGGVGPEKEQAAGPYAGTAVLPKPDDPAAYGQHVIVSRAPRRIERKGFDPEALSAFVRRKLPDYMVPSVWVPLKELPLSANGKVDRQALPIPAQAQPEQACLAPCTPIELALAAIWKELLGAEPIGRKDSFFELGGDSLLATRFGAMARDRLGVELPLGDLFEGPTIAELAERAEARIEAKRSSEADAAACLPSIVPAPDEEHLPFPLTDIQQAYLVGRSGVFALGNVSTQCYFELEGTDLQLERVNRAWQRLIDRHGMMRAIILPDGLHQRILERVPPYRIAADDLRGLDPQDAEAELLRIRETMSRQVLPTAEWPLFDVRASLLGDGRVRLHISFDNLLFDGWSVVHLLNEWNRLYHDPSYELPSLALSFRDYVLALERLKTTERYQRDREYWMSRLPGLPPAPELPLAQSPEAVVRPRFRRRGAKLGRDTWRRLKQRAAEAGVTPSGLLLAAYAEVLAAWSRVPRFTINLPQFHRLPLHPHIQQLVGDFTSLTLLAADASSGSTFLERARNVQQQLWLDLDHPYVGGVQVQREWARRSGDSQGAVMPVVFTSMLGVDRSDEDGAGGKWLGKLVYSMTQTPQVWLDHQAMEQDGKLLLHWDAVEELFPQGLLDDMFAAYVHVLQRLANDSSAWHEEIRNLAAVPRLEPRIEANRTEAPVSEHTLADLFAAQAARHPDRTAIVGPGYDLTYGEAARRSDAVAKLLQDKGARPGTLVAVAMEKGWEQAVAVLGILKSGAAYLPIDPAYPLERRLQLLRDSQTRIILTQSALDWRMEWPEDVERLHVDAIGGAGEEGRPLPANAAGRPGDLAYVIYTSGSTGEPKGVMIDHRGAVNTILDVNRRFGIGPEDRVLALSNLNFDLSVYDIFGMLAAGAAIVMPEADAVRNPARWLEWMHRERVTVWNTVPALMQMLLEYASGMRAPLPPTLRLVLLSGDWIPLDLPDAIRAHGSGIQVIALGGATEASIWSNWHPVQDVDPSWRSIPYGRPLTNQRYYVLNEWMGDCPVWVPGQLYIGGVGLAKGYWNDETRTNEKFVRHPRTGERIYATGDLGRYLPDGSIEFLGRQDFQVKIKGHRMELGDIETALKRLDGIKDAAVAVTGEASGERQLVGCVVLDDAGPSEWLETLHADPAVCAARWQAFLGSARLQAVQEPDEADLEAAARFIAYTDRLSLSVIGDTLHSLGMFACAGESGSIDELMRRYSLHPRYRTLLEHWLNILVEEGWLQLNEASAYRCLRPLQGHLPEHGLDSGLEPALAEKVRQLRTSLQRGRASLIGMLTGKLDPLELHAAEDAYLTPEALRGFNPARPHSVRLACEAFRSLMNECPPDQEVRVLEVGSRAGGLAEALMPLLPAGRSRYLLADESSFFTDRARGKSGEAASLEYALFDMNKDPQQQGFALHSFDVIVADNALHRAKNVETALEHLRKLLAPGGHLLFVEATRNHRLMLTTAAFFEDGFSHMEDERQTTRLPLLPAERWRKLLAAQGFVRALAWPEPGRAADRFGQHVFAAQAPEAVRVFQPAKLSAALRRKLPDYMVPAAYVPLKELPLSANGKVDRKALAALGPAAGRPSGKHRAAPATALQVKIAGVWEEVLGGIQPGIDDSFFELGGDSLRAIQAINLLRERHRIELSMRQLFEASTIRRLAPLLEAEADAAKREADMEYEEGIV